MFVRDILTIKHEILKEYSHGQGEIGNCRGIFFSDNTVLIWDTKDLEAKNHNSIRVNIEFDFATFIRWSPDNHAFIVNKSVGNCIEVYRVEKKEKDRWIGPITKALTFPQIHKEAVAGMGIAPNGKYIMSCSEKTDLAIMDLKGHVLGTTDTVLGNTTCAKVSPCGKLIAATGWSPDCKVWEVSFDKSGEFQGIKRAFELSGHTSGIEDVAFDADSSHMVTVSKDGTWKLFDTKIDYKRGQSPYLKTTGKYEIGSKPAHVALSPDLEVVAVGAGNDLFFFKADCGSLDQEIRDLYEEPDHITKVMFDASGKYVLTSGSNKVHIFHNVTGYKCQIASSEEKLKQHQTSATKERLEKMIRDNREFLKGIRAKETEFKDSVIH